jgi:hypothetical protein
MEPTSAASGFAGDERSPLVTEQLAMRSLQGMRAGASRRTKACRT